MCGSHALSLVDLRIWLRSLAATAQMHERAGRVIEARMDWRRHEIVRQSLDARRER